MDSEFILEVKAANPIAALHIKKFGYGGDAGLDLYADVPGGLVIKPGQRVLVDTGFSVHIKNKAYAGLLLPRSGLGSNYGIILGNAVGLIDSGYTGPLKVCLWNTSDTPYTVKPWDRIAQMIVIPIVHFTVKEVKQFEETERGDKGFGSSGR